MKLSVQWLREWVAFKPGTRALADRLTQAGLEVGGIEPAAAVLEHVVVGEILSMAPHPQADRLRVCQVDVGRKSPLTIVCGAANAAVGQRVPAALEGAVLANGTRIARAALRGVESAGMLCSTSELGLEETSTGLLELGPDSRPGTPIVKALRLDDEILEIDLTPNRGDCLSVSGLAREVAALTGLRSETPTIKPVPVKSQRKLAVTLAAKKACPRYVGRVIEGINPHASTPLWMRERLRRAEVRSIHPVVDITNLVMLELGQPMHAFDLKALKGAIRVRAARAGESLTLLDGKTLALAPADLVIADQHRVLALAGIMGGEDSGVSAQTTDLFLESAWFHPDAVGVRARQYGLHSESSHRFERGVDPGVQRLALERASALILQICGGRAGPVTEVLSAANLPKRPAITLRASRIARVLGMALAPARVETILKRLGMRVVRATGKADRIWKVIAPSWRFDVTREVDLIEELARVHGYDKVPVHAPSAELHVAPAPETHVAESRLRTVLVDRDYQEAVTYSFVDPTMQQLLYPNQPAITLANPIASDLAQMRVSLWPGLIQILRYNQNRQQSRVRIFEIGRRYLVGNGGATEEQKIVSGAVCGNAAAEQWGIKGRPADFFDVKADVEALLALSGQDFVFRPGRHPSLHPGQTAEIALRGQTQPVGLVGTLHPEIQTKSGLDSSVILFEIEAAALQAAIIREFREISRFPAIRRDIAVVLRSDAPAQAVLDCVQKSAGQLLVNLELFDEYRGEGIDSGRKSLALGLTFQDSSRTLNDEDVEAVMGRVVAALQADFDARLRQ